MDRVGNYIRQLRNEKGLTQEQLGEMVGVQKAAVQKWENGSVQNLKRATIKKLAEIFGVSPASFVKDDALDLSSDQLTLTADEKLLLDKDETQIIKAYRSFNDEGKEKVRDMIQDMQLLDHYKKRADNEVDKKEA